MGDGIINHAGLTASAMLAAVAKFLEEGGDAARKQLTHVYLECAALGDAEEGEHAEQWLLWYAGYGMGPEPQPEELLTGQRVAHRLSGQRGVVTEGRPLTVRYSGDNAEENGLAMPERWELKEDNSVTARRGRYPEIR